jgi:cell wall-active antibiotic response 4TMS protein YvqF
MTDGNTQSHGLGLDIGILLVLTGALLLVHNLNVLQDLFDYWPVILIAVGVAKLMEPGERTTIRP